MGFRFLKIPIIRKTKEKEQSKLIQYTRILKVGPTGLNEVQKEGHQITKKTNDVLAIN